MPSTPLNSLRKPSSFIKKIGQSLFALYPGFIAGFILGFERTLVQVMGKYLIEGFFIPLEQKLTDFVSGTLLKAVFLIPASALILITTVIISPIGIAASLLFGLYGMAYGAYTGFRYDVFFYENIVDLLNLSRWSQNEDLSEEYKAFCSHYSRTHGISFDLEEDELPDRTETLFDLCHGQDKNAKKMAYGYMAYTQQMVYNAGESHAVKWRKLDHKKQFEYAKRTEAGKFVDLNAMNYYKSIHYDWCQDLPTAQDDDLIFSMKYRQTSELLNYKLLLAFFHESEFKTHRIKLLESLLFFTCDNFLYDEIPYEEVLDFLSQPHPNSGPLDQEKIQTRVTQIVQAVKAQPVLENSYLRLFTILLNESDEESREIIETILDAEKPDALLQFKCEFHKICQTTKMSEIKKSLQNKILLPLIEMVNGYAFALFDKDKTPEVLEEKISNGLTR